MATNTPNKRPIDAGLQLTTRNLPFKQKKTRKPVKPINLNMMRRSNCTTQSFKQRLAAWLLAVE